MSSKGRQKKQAADAKKRRDDLGEAMSSLAAVLPHPQHVVHKLDQLSILRLAIHYLRMKKYSTGETNGQKKDLCVPAMDKTVKRMLHTLEPDHIERKNRLTDPYAIQQDIQEGDIMLKALNGFLIFVCRNGNIYYVSPHVEEILGMKMEDIIGHNILEFVPADDHRELAKQFCEQKPPGSRELVAPIDPNWDCMSEEAAGLEDIDIDHFVRERLFYIRMKSYVQTGQKQRKTKYIYLQWSGRLKLRKAIEKSSGQAILGLVAICRPTQSNILNITLNDNSFTSRHDLSMRFISCDDSIVRLVGYHPHEVIGRTAYQFHNPHDAPKIHTCHSTLIKKGQSTSRYYRFLSKNGTYIWMQTQAYIVHEEPQEYVTCINWIITAEEGKRALMLEVEEAGTCDPDVPAVIDLNSGATPQPPPQAQSKNRVGGATKSKKPSSNPQNCSFPSNNNSFANVSPPEKPIVAPMHEDRYDMCNGILNNCPGPVENLMTCENQFPFTPNMFKIGEDVTSPQQPSNFPSMVDSSDSSQSPPPSADPCIGNSKCKVVVLPVENGNSDSSSKACGGLCNIVRKRMDDDVSSWLSSAKNAIEMMQYSGDTCNLNDDFWGDSGLVPNSSNTDLTLSSNSSYNDLTQSAGNTESAASMPSSVQTNEPQYPDFDVMTNELAKQCAEILDTDCSFSPDLSDLDGISDLLQANPPVSSVSSVQQTDPTITAITPSAISSMSLNGDPCGLQTGSCNLEAANIVGSELSPLMYLLTTNEHHDPNKGSKFL